MLRIAPQHEGLDKTEPMPDDFSSDFFVANTDRDPLRTVQKDMKRALPKRFYKKASVAPRDGGWAVLLDGSPLPLAQMFDGAKLTAPVLAAPPHYLDDLRTRLRFVGRP